MLWPVQAWPGDTEMKTTWAQQQMGWKLSRQGECRADILEEVCLSWILMGE